MLLESSLKMVYMAKNILKPPKLTPKSTTKTKSKTKKQQEQENKEKIESRNQKSLKIYFEKQAAENKEKQQQTKQITEIKTTRPNTPTLAKQAKETKITTRSDKTKKKEEMSDSNLATSSAKITPTLSVKVLGKNVSDLMSLKSYLARKKSERDSKQAQIRRPSSANSDSSQSNAAMHAHSGENVLHSS